MIVQLKFSYPRRGLSGRFNTFRLGTAAARLPVGELVELVDSRTGRVLKRATVQSVSVGQLRDMALLHAHNAHNWKDHPEEQRSDLLMASLKRRYPPNRVVDTSIVTVIELLEVPDDRVPEPRMGG